MKKSNILVAVMTLLIVFLFNFCLKSANVSAQTTSANWYKTVLNTDIGMYKAKYVGGYSKKNSLGKKTVYRKEFKEYAVLDINKDGKKELLLSTGGYYPKVLVLTYYKKKVVPLYIFGNVQGIYYKGKTLTYVFGTSSENTARMFKLKKGKLSAILNAFHTTSSAYYVPICKLNGKKCSETKFHKKYDKYMKNSKYITFLTI